MLKMARSVLVILQTCYPFKRIFSNDRNMFPCQLHKYIANKNVYRNRESVLCYSTMLDDETEDNTNKAKVNKAMKAYLERAKQHDEFMKDQLHQYNVGKRHLANMMGEDPETFTQKDIDRSIQYLFPSGIFEPKARPLMKPPEEIFPARKAAEFDETGRPHHFLFYTGNPNLYNLLFDLVTHMNALNEFEDKMIRKHLIPDSTQTLNMGGTEWISKEELEKLLVENIRDRQYSDFISAMERLLEHPYSYRVKDFIDKYRKPIMKQLKIEDIPKPEYGADGRAYVTTKGCMRKTARGEVTVRSPGTGLIRINDKSIEYFESLQDREQILFPLVFTNLIGGVDIEATVTGGGTSGQSGVIRYGIAMALRSFVDKEMVERMRIAGLLQRDYRRRERKKPGQAGARRKYTWKKR